MKVIIARGVPEIFNSGELRLHSIRYEGVSLLARYHVIKFAYINQVVKYLGFMNPNEEKIMEEMKTPHNKYFVPLVWTTSLVTRARKEGRIKDDFGVKTLVDVRLLF